MRVLLLVALVGCAAAPRYAATTLERSVFAHDPAGKLSEEDVQRLLSARLDVAFPARVGVVPIVTATDWRGPSPDYARVPHGTAALVSGLGGGAPFSLVTEVLPIPSGALGMEALREVAARYALRYILLYREDLRERTEWNALAAGYVTLLGALFLPGQTLAVDGFIEASLFDVQTGLLLFTVRRVVHGDRGSNVWHGDRKLEELARALVERAAPELARDVRGDVDRFVEAVVKPST